MIQQNYVIFGLEIVLPRQFPSNDETPTKPLSGLSNLKRVWASHRTGIHGSSVFKFSLVSSVLEFKMLVFEKLCFNLYKQDCMQATICAHPSTRKTVD